MAAPHQHHDITAPWDDATVDALNHWQNESGFHPFTCDNSPHYPDAKQSLIATSTGWACPRCAYVQDWAHCFMANRCAG